MLLKPIKINKIILKNKIVVSPMCQYSAKKGSPSFWHYEHLKKLSNSGAALLMIESTAVSKIGRITHNDLCLYNNTHEKNLKKLFKFLKINNAQNIGIQISHSGRKGSAEIPWVRRNNPLNKNKWNTVSASAIKKDKNWPTPKVLTIKEIKNISNQFEQCAKKAKRIGFDCLEIHMAHGYLLHQFFSNISNKRKDLYGGNLINRTRLLIEVASKVRSQWPKSRILGARITGSDRLEKGIKPKDAYYLVKELEKVGFDYICVSSGGIKTKTKLNIKKDCFNVDIARNIKKKTSLLIRCSGRIDYNHATKLINSKKIDLICVGREFIKNPNWLIKVLKNNGNDKIIPNQYKRCF